MTKVWNDMLGGRWQDDANWLPMMAATAGDDAVIAGPGSGSAAVTGAGVSASLKLTGDLTLSGTFTTGALTIGALTIGALTIGGAGQGTAVTLSNAAITATSLTLAGTALSLGGDSAVRNTVEISSAGTAGAGFLQVDAGFAITGSGTLGGFYNDGVVEAVGGTMTIDG